MTNSLPATQGKSPLPDAIYDKSDSVLALALRAAVAAIPIVGGSISVLVEAHLSAHRADVINRLFQRISELEQKGAGSRLHHTPYSDALLTRAIHSAIASDDPARAPIFANVLYIDPNADPSETVRQYLIEICSTLTRYELALLLSLSRTTIDPTTTTDFARALLQLRLNTPDLEDIHAFALARLANFRLLTDATTKAEVTPLGRKLL